MRILLDLETDRRTLRYATTPADVTDADGNTYRYAPGLPRQPIDVLAPALSAVLPPPVGETWGEVFESGERIEGSPLVFRWHADGQTLEDCTIILRATAREIILGGGPQPLRMTAEATARGEDREAPPTGHLLIVDGNWPKGAANIANSADDRIPYPVVYGYPGAHDNGDTYHAYRVPCVLIDTSSGEDYFVVGDGVIAAEGGGIEVVKVDTEADHTTTTMTVTSTRQNVDLYGVGVTIGVQGIGATDPTDGAEYYCGHDRLQGGGIPRIDSGEPASLAVDVIVALLKRYTSIPVDIGRMEAAAERLAGFRFDGALEEPEMLWEYIQAEMLPLLPVAVRWSNAGLYLAVLEYAPTMADVVAEYELGTATLHRSSDATMRFDIYNRHEIAFAMDRHGPRDWRAVVGDRDAGTTQWYNGVNPSYVQDLRCRISEARYGVRQAPTIETPCVWEGATASKILRWRAARHALPIWAVEYTGGPGLLRHDIGDVLLVTDPDMGWQDRYALIEGMTIGTTEVSLDLSILPPPVDAQA